MPYIDASCSAIKGDVTLLNVNLSFNHGLDQIMDSSYRVCDISWIIILMYKQSRFDLGRPASENLNVVSTSVNGFLRLSFLAENRRRASENCTSTQWLQRSACRNFQDNYVIFPQKHILKNKNELFFILNVRAPIIDLGPGRVCDHLQMPLPHPSLIIPTPSRPIHMPLQITDSITKDKHLKTNSWYRSMTDFPKICYKFS